MASGTIYGSTSNQYIDSKIEWNSTVISNSSNSSEVMASLFYKRNNYGYTTHGTGTFSLTIDGSTQSASKTLSIEDDAWVLAVTHTKTVAHNDYGKKSVTFSASGSIPGTTLSSTSCSGRGSLDEIPRASEISRVSDINLGGSCDVTWIPKSTAFSYKIDFSLGTWKSSTGMIAPQTNSQFTYRGHAIPYEVAEQFPTATSGTMTATLTTYVYHDGVAYQIGTAHSKTFKVTLPQYDATKPSVAMSVSPVSTLPSAFSGLYIQGKSRAEVSFTGEGKYGATISSYGLTVLGKGYASPFQTELISKSGSVQIEGRAKDSRGFVTYVYQNISVIPYSKPKLTPASGATAIVCARCDSSGNLSDSGTYLKIKVGRDYSKVMSGSTQKNFCSLRYRYKVGGGSAYSSYTTILAKDSSTDSVDVTIGNVVSSLTTSYAVEISAVDDIGEEATITFNVPTEEVAFHLKEGGNGAAFGKYAERDKTLDIAPDWGIRYKGDDIERQFYSLRGNAVIPSGSNLNNFLTPNIYAVATDTDAGNITNMPPTKRAGLIKVYASTGQEKVTEGTWRYIMQEYRCVLAGVPTYYRKISSNESGVWEYGEWEMERGSDTGWVALKQSGNASAPSTVTRGGAGCFYRVINDRHVFVRFNCAFTFSGSSININSETIPSQYRPKNNAMALLPVNDRGIARASVASDGYIYVNYVQNMATASTTTSFSVTWIDGYIDYFI